MCHYQTLISTLAYEDDQLTTAQRAALVRPIDLSVAHRQGASNWAARDRVAEEGSAVTDTGASRCCGRNIAPDPWQWSRADQWRRIDVIGLACCGLEPRAIPVPRNVRAPCEQVTTRTAASQHHSCCIMTHPSGNDEERSSVLLGGRRGIL